MKTLSLSFLFLAIGIFAFTGCTSPEHKSEEPAAPAQPAFNLEPVKSYIMNEYPAKFGDAFSKGDSAGVAALYTSDGMAMQPNGPTATGTQQIVSLISAYMKMGAKGVKLSPAEVIGGAEGVFASGTFQLTGDNNTVIDNGKYCEFWKEENGTWKVHRDIWNSNTPPPPPAKK